MQYRLEDDGVTHINMYSRGKTLLGRQLSHFYDAPFVHPLYGEFRTMEGFWHYVASGCQIETLRTLPGWKVKQLSKTLTRVERADFQQLIREGNECKIKQHPEIYRAFKASELPLDHYYVINESVMIRPKNLAWLTELFENLRASIKS